MLKIKITDFYDEFRPYNETEAKEAIIRISDNERFYKIVNYFFPELNKTEFKNLLFSLNSIYDFQKNFMLKILNKIIEDTTHGFTYSGLENIKKNKNYVFISNHRDIILDATFFQTIFMTNSIPTTEVTFGNNLMQDPLVYDVGKINKMFKVYRKGTPKELLKKTIQLSEYIRYTLFKKKQSVWIAQRGGRTKDGNDKTQTGILKMLNSSGNKCFEDNMNELNLIPVSISYEFEPNDQLKVKELLNTVNGKYEKSEEEDIQSIIDGVCSEKGRIHINIGNCLNTKLLELENITRTNQKVFKLAEILNNQIYKNYKLWPNNYIAYDIVNNTTKYQEYYNKDEKEKFLTYKNEQLDKIKDHSEKAESLFFNIYANPVINFENIVLA